MKTYYLSEHNVDTEEEIPCFENGKTFRIETNMISNSNPNELTRDKYFSKIEITIGTAMQYA